MGLLGKLFSPVILPFPAAVTSSGSNSRNASLKYHLIKHGKGHTPVEYIKDA